jgi:hypothetical protein
MTQLFAAVVVAAATTMAPMSHSSMATPAPQPKPNASETAFIQSVTTGLFAAYPTVTKATAAGYIRMTKLESDNTYVYSTMTYSKIDRLHPNFLWYDRNGKLVGLDYEYAKSSSPQFPGMSVYPVMASRWVTIPQHVHFAYTVGSGPVQTHGWKALPNLRGDVITAQELIADGLLPKGAKLVWAHFHPACWDLGFWLVPNPNGAFADLDPAVK